VKPVIHASDNFIKALKYPVKQLYIKLELYDSQMNFIKEITRDVESDVGTLTIDRNRPIRRSFSLTLNNTKGDFTWGENKLFWIDKRIKLFVGLKYGNSIEYVPQGIFILNEPSDSHNFDGKKTTINCYDKMSLMSEKRGKMLYETTIETGTNVKDAIKILAQKVGETMFNFDSDISATVPYEITYSPQDNIYQAIKDLADFAQADIYYDENGYLRLKKIDLNDIQNYPPVWKFSINDSNQRFYVGNVRKLDDGQMANHIMVLGGSSQTAIARYELKVTESDPLWQDNPYTIEKIGDILYFHNDGNPDPVITTNDEAKWRAKYELMKRLGYAERVSLTLAPHYLLDAGDVIELEDYNVSGRYLIESINIPLKPDVMTVECRKERKIIDDWDFI
jgi:hypothetical protein